MRLELRNNKDFWAGMMFFGTGAGAMIIARHYPFGTTLRMGPGYFPMVLGGILIVFGAFIMLRGLRTNEKIQGPWSLAGLDHAAALRRRIRHADEPGGLHPGPDGADLRVGGREPGVQVQGGPAADPLSERAFVAMFIWGLGLPYPLIKKF